MKLIVLVDLYLFELVDMLVNRFIEYWNDGKDDAVADLYRKMYENEVANGVFEGGKFNVMEIVDNDYVNYCDIISEGDEGFEEILNLYKEGNYDISGDTNYSYIEAVDNEDSPTMFLVRN